MSQKKKFNYDSLKKLRSEYLDGGFRQDIFEIKEVEWSKDSITATVDFTHYYMPADGQFHLSILWATTIVMQLAIIFSCLSNNYEKEKEVYLRELKWKCKRTINKDKDLKLTIYNIVSKQRGDRIYYHAEIDVEDNKFFGYGSWIFDL